MASKIFILMCHPDSGQTLNRGLADAYEKGARAAGHDVRRLNLAELSFDPVLHRGYKEIQELEPDLCTVQEHIKWADHLVFFYPNWWSGMPALLKGMFDRMILPGFAFNFDRKIPLLWTKRLTGRTARVIITTDGAPFFSWLFVGDKANDIRSGILGFCGIRAHVNRVWLVKFMSEARFKRLAVKMELWGRCAK